MVVLTKKGLRLEMPLKSVQAWVVRIQASLELHLGLLAEWGKVGVREAVSLVSFPSGDDLDNGFRKSPVAVIADLLELFKVSCSKSSSCRLSEGPHAASNSCAGNM